MSAAFGNLMFFFLLFAPSFIYVAFSAGSMAAGLTVFIICTLLCKVYQSNSLSLVGSKNYLSLVLVLCCYLFSLIEFSARSIMSIILFVILVVAASVFSQLLDRTKDRALVLSINRTVVIYLVLLYFSIVFNLSVFSYSKYAKAIFPFAEPSHYAITMAPFYIFYITEKKVKGVIVTILLLIAGLILPSLILLVLSGLMLSMVVLKSKYRLILLVITVTLLFFVIMLTLDKIGYFTERLIIASSSKNLSALVYLQGWEESFNALIDTKGVGLGFQNLGKQSPGIIAEKINILAGKYKNRSDGGFLAAKLIGEFGIIGLLIVISVTIRIVISYFNLVKFRKIKKERSIKYYFADSVIVAFGFELFLRGYGYFTSGVFLFICAVFIIKCQKRILCQSC